ncbi:hypothetical protein AAKU55_005642 [Oxalobacteraceae bacterium GrIS 1.11]
MTNSEADFWELYIAVVCPEGVECFGQNLNAFWDAISGGGPGWPGECIIELINVESFIKRNKKFYKRFQQITQDVVNHPEVKIILPTTHQ